MRRRIRTLSMILVIGGLALVQAPRPAQADDDHKKDLIVTMTFGAAFMGSGQMPATHLLLPRTVHLRAGGIVNFVVGGVHEIFVYKPGTTPDDVLLNAPPFPGSDFINYGLLPSGLPDANILLYVGVNPGNNAFPTGANPARPPNPLTRSNLQNRVESVYFAEPGTYLVICNINPHFRSGMYAWVKVKGKDNKTD